MSRFFSSDYNFFHPAYWFGDMDARPVSLFRIAFGALILKEALYHIPLAAAFYSESGITPTSVLEQVGVGGRFSPLNAMPQAWMAILFFALWALVALGLMLGWRTCLMTILNFVFLISVNNRNPMVVSGAEVAMNAFAFWCLFIPLGRCYSLDARRRSRPQSAPATIFAFPVRMLQIQVALIYIFTTIIKLQGKSWPDGSALYRTLQIQLYTFPTGDWLLANAPLGLLQFLTLFTLVVEGSFALLVFAPFLQPYLRGVGLLLGTLLHIGIGVTMAIFNFPLVMLSSYLVFFDTRWMDWLEARTAKMVERLRRRTKYTLPFPYSEAETPDPIIQKTTRPDESRRNGGGGLLAAMARAAVLGGYRSALALVLVLSMIGVIWSNILSNDTLAFNMNVNPMTAELQGLMRSLGIEQSWSLFAPEPLRNDGYFILAGQYKDGRLLDVRTGQPPGVVRPKWLIGPWSRWSKFEEFMMNAAAFNPIFAAWGQYTCREDSDLTSLQIILRARPAAAPGEPFQDFQDQVIWQGDC